MGRPIHKKYFGNTSVPPIGGEGVASIAIGGTNTNKTAVPAIVIAAPQLPEGVQAVARARMEVETIINFTSGAGYTPGQVLTLTGGTGTQATITVNTTSVATVTVTAGQGGTGYTTGDVVTIQGGTGTLATATVIANAGVVTGFSTFTPGSYTVNPTTLLGAATVKTGGTGDDALQVDITMGLGTVTLTTAGDYTALPADISIVGHSGTGGALFNLDYKVKSVEVTTAGSGYMTAPAITTQGGTTFTATLTSGTGGNAITMTGRIVAGSTVQLDVIKQTGSRRYLVKNGSTVGVVKLVGDAVDAAGEANIVATDSAGGTYYVTKLTAHRAILTRDTGTQFATGQSVKWTLGAPTLNQTVKIANA